MTEPNDDAAARTARLQQKGLISTGVRPRKGINGLPLAALGPVQSAQQQRRENNTFGWLLPPVTAPPPRITPSPIELQPEREPARPPQSKSPALRQRLSAQEEAILADARIRLAKTSSSLPDIAESATPSRPVTQGGDRPATHDGGGEGSSSGASSPRSPSRRGRSSCPSVLDTPAWHGGARMAQTGQGAAALGASEDAIMAAASHMGLLKHLAHTESLSLTTSPKPRGRATMTVNQISPLGISFRAFEALLESVAGEMYAELSTFEAMQQVVMPQTASLKCRYTDLLPEKMVDTPTLYVVHCWQGNFVSTLEAVRQYVALQRTNTDDVYIWMDVLCVNHHHDRAMLDLGVIKEIIQSADRVLVVLDRQGRVFRRTWCLWEMWLVSGAERGDKLVPFLFTWTWEDMLHPYLTMDLGLSRATRDRERTMLAADMQRLSDSGLLGSTVRDALILGAKRDMNRSEKLASVNPRRFGTAAGAYATLLAMSSRFGEAEDVVRQVLRLFDRLGSKEVPDRDLAIATFQMACILRDQGRLPDAERALQEFVSRFKGMRDEVYMDGVSTLADILTGRRSYTKAEMLARKLVEVKTKLFGAEHPHMIKSLLQLARIAAAQKLHDEAEEHLRHTLAIVSTTSFAENPDAAAAYHLMGMCAFRTGRVAEAKGLLEKAARIRSFVMGADHTTTLDTRAFQAEIMIKEKNLKEAEVVLTAICAARARACGPEHHDTLASTGQLADLLRDMRRDDDAEELENKIIGVGRQLLRHTKIDRYMSVSFVTNYLAERDHLLDKAAMFLAKAYIVCKEKLGVEHDLTVVTRRQLGDIIEKVQWVGSNALEQAQIFSSPAQFSVAEVMYKQAYSISKLVAPEGDHKALAQGLADALFGQGKVQEAKSVLRAAGLSRKGMKQNMPASYLRWLNKRVAKYMDKSAEEDEG